MKSFIFLALAGAGIGYEYVGNDGGAFGFGVAALIWIVLYK